MSDNYSSRQDTDASTEANLSGSSANKQTESGHAQSSNQVAHDASSAAKEDDAPVREPVQLKSHFKGMPKDWPINKSTRFPRAVHELSTNLAQDKEQ